MSVLVGSVLLLVALLLLAIGLLAWRQALPRNRFVGVRTPEALGSDDSFRLANRVAAPAVLAGGVACLLGGGTAFGTTGATLAVVAAVCGLGALVLVAAGGLLGHRAAATVPAGEPVGCGGCGCCQAGAGSDRWGQLRDRSVG